MSLRLCQPRSKLSRANQLTDRGRALLPAMVALMQWGDRWASANKPPVMVTDDNGRPVAAVKLKSAGGDVTAETVRFHPGPGATARTRAFFNGLSVPDGAGAPSKTILKKSEF